MGQPMGAFTWAATSTLSLWSPKVDDGVVSLDISYGTLMDKVQRLLGLFPSITQEPVMHGPKDMDKMAFLQTGIVDTGKETSETATARKPGLQIDTGWLQANQIGQIRLRVEALNPSIGQWGYTTLADVFIASDDLSNCNTTIAGKAVVPNTEYWCIHVANFIDMKKSWDPEKSRLGIDPVTNSPIIDATEQQDIGLTGSAYSWFTADAKNVEDTTADDIGWNPMNSFDSNQAFSFVFGGDGEQGAGLRSVILYEGGGEQGAVLTKVLWVKRILQGARQNFKPIEELYGRELLPGTPPTNNGGNSGFYASSSDLKPFES
jgi:hypothetical protein